MDDQTTYKIKGVEVFSAGEWNKDKYSIEDLHSMVTAFNSLKGGFKPYLKLGHDENQKLAKNSGLPSVGWVENLYVRGDKLVADLEYIPEKIYKLIKSKAYRKVSCEIYWDLDVNGNKYPRVVGAIALLGAETPGVLNLNDILGNYALLHNSKGGVFEAMDKRDNFKSYSIKFESQEDNVDLEQVQAELEAQKKSYAKAQEDLAAKAKETEEAHVELSKLREEVAKANAEATASKLAKFVVELESKKLVTPAMKDMVTELMSDKKEYSIADKKMTKEEVVTQLLSLSQEAGKVNFSEKTKADFAKKEDKTEAADKEIKKYAEDNKCSYAQAYKAVMKSKDVSSEDKEE